MTSMADGGADGSSREETESDDVDVRVFLVL